MHCLQIMDSGVEASAALKWSVVISFDCLLLSCSTYALLSMLSSQMAVAAEQLISFGVICEVARIKMEGELSDGVVPGDYSDAEREMFYMDDLSVDGETCDLSEFDSATAFDEASKEAVSLDVFSTLVEPNRELVNEVESGLQVAEQNHSDQADASSSGLRQDLLEVSLPGLRLLPDPALEEAGRGLEKLPSAWNDQWAVRRADGLRKGMGWDLSVAFGDLLLVQVDELLSNYFARAVKKDGNVYPSSSLMNQMNSFNRVLRRGSDLRSLKGSSYILPRDFNINSHPAFSRTRMVLKAAIKKSAKEGANKKRKKVEILTEEHEKAIMADIDHQVTSSHGCQKRLAFYCLVRLGIRGGGELYDLHRGDLSVCIDKAGRNYVQFEERQSKNNSYMLDRYNEEQFRKMYHSYEVDFVFTVNQYKRHLSPEAESSKPDLFMQTITNPARNVWYNKVHKVGRDTAAHWLKNMLALVGLPPDLFSNRTGRTTLISRLAAKGVPDVVGMLISGHHSTGGYSRYDKTQELKMEAAALVSASPGLDYEKALGHVSKSFVREKLVGSSEGLKPLVDRVNEKANVQPSLLTLVQGSTGSSGVLGETSARASEQDGSHIVGDMLVQRADAARWDSSYDGIDWVGELLKQNPLLHEKISGPTPARVSVGSNMSGNSFHNCSVSIKIVKAGEEDEKENAGH